jgi:uncharacterized LabA/DUF88 family protein
MFFVDGENLVLRYKGMLEKGYKPLNGTNYEEDVFVWHPDIIRNTSRDIVRVTYYTSAAGDEGKILSISEEIKKVKYFFKGQPYAIGSGGFGESKSEQYYGYIFPCVFKKESKSLRSRLVDISITIDMLNYASPTNLDAMYLVSGDGDFLPLIKAVMRKGMRVHLMALSDGLNPQLPISVDEFECIDDRLFERKQQ